MSGNSELACVYAALILADDDVAITVSTKFEASWKSWKSQHYFWNFITEFEDMCKVFPKCNDLQV